MELKIISPVLSDESCILSSIQYLKIRIMVLNNRMQELNSGEYGILYNDFCDAKYRKDELGYITPDYMFRYSDIETALAIAYGELLRLSTEEVNSMAHNNKRHSLKEHVPEHRLHEYAA